MSDLNNIYQILGSLQQSVKHIHDTVDEIKQDNKETKKTVAKHETIINRAVTYCVALSIGAGGAVSYVPKAIAGIFK